MKNAFQAIVSAAAVLILLSTSNVVAEPVDLQEALKEKIVASSTMVPDPAKAVMVAAQKELAASKITASAPEIGQALPDGKFIDAHSTSTSLFKQIGNSAAVVTFYRGGWCPYCNLQLHYYQKALPEIIAAGGKLVAITPETPDNSLSTSQKHSLEFDVLSDTNNEYAKKLGIVFKLSQPLLEVYEQFGINLQTSQGNENSELPLSATFVIDKNRIVKYRFVDVDYKKRAAVVDIVAALNKLKQE